MVFRTIAIMLALATGTPLAAEQAALERAADVVDRVAVRVRDDLVQVGARVHADQADRLDVEARLLEHLADDGHGHGLAELDRPAGEPPAAVVAPPVEQKPLGREDDPRDARPDDLLRHAGRSISFCPTPLSIAPWTSASPSPPASTRGRR